MRPCLRAWQYAPVRPVLFEPFGVPVPAYPFFMALAFVLAYLVRRAEVRRLGYHAEPGHAWVGVGALVGAVVGSKVGMVLFLPPRDWAQLVSQMADFDFTGKTVVGALAGGFIGVEVAKKIAGITHSTGDGFAVALPLAQGIGRLGCFFHGCCYGAPTEVPWAVSLGGGPRHPVQLCEAGLDLVLAAALFFVRRGPRPEGHLFRTYLVAYALIRFALEPLRGDAAQRLGPLTLVQWACLAAAAGFTLVMARERQKVSATPSPQG
jgi:prolipoprotein diacylglyceryltransferase